jgi:hypothetical protein
MMLEPVKGVTLNVQIGDRRIKVATIDFDANTVNLILSDTVEIEGLINYGIVEAEFEQMVPLNAKNDTEIVRVNEMSDKYL